MLELVSLMAQNAQPTHRAIALELGRRLGLPIRFDQEADWATRAARLAVGQAQLGFICGLPYVRQQGLELLAAPVMQGRRYGGRPVYFSDVVVRAESSYRSFADLRGARWAYNEPGSMSGYLITCYELAQRGETASFFGRTIESGAHLASLQLLLEGEVDASAIDSTVFDLALADNLQLTDRLRSIAMLGPSPIPPLVASRELPLELRQELRRALLELHQDAEGRAALDLGLIARFVEVDDADYDDIRHKAGVAAGLRL